MKTFKKMLLIISLTIIFVYINCLDSIPSSVILFEGDNLSIPTIFGINISNELATTVSDDIEDNKLQENNYNESGTYNLSVNIANLKLKDINVNVIPKQSVVVCGNSIGAKLYTNGVLIVGMSEIEGVDNIKYKPYENTGIEEGDMIVEINSSAITCTADLIKNVNRCEGKSVNIKYVREGEEKQTSVLPVETAKNEYKLGLWVRDSAAGVGTVTFYEPSTKTFGALGHGITDIDTNELINIASGEFITTRVLNITKGESGEPGKIQGTIENQQNIGTISKNSKFGIYGRVDNLSSLNVDTSKEMEVALRNEIQLGKATILCSLDNQKPQEYEIEIQKIYTENNYDNKSMQIKVTDQKLIEKTGGIIQGMSGSPIIQNGKFVGAVTHVLVNNPQEGYAVFGDIMLKQSKSVQQ